MFPIPKSIKLLELEYTSKYQSDYEKYYLVEREINKKDKLKELQRQAFKTFNLTNYDKLIDEITNKRDQISKGFSKYKPIVVKISPDESLNNLEKIISYSLTSGVDGFI